MVLACLFRSGVLSAILWQYFALQSIKLSLASPVVLIDVAVRFSLLSPRWGDHPAAADVIEPSGLNKRGRVYTDGGRPRPLPRAWAEATPGDGRGRW